MVPRNGYIFRASCQSRRRASFLAITASRPTFPRSAFRAWKGGTILTTSRSDLTYSDVDRVKEWRRELSAFLREDRVPQLEYLWLPNDHTAASHPGMLTCRSRASRKTTTPTGLLVDTVSHSPIWEIVRHLHHRRRRARRTRSRERSAHRISARVAVRAGRRTARTLLDDRGAAHDRKTILRNPPAFAVRCDGSFARRRVPSSEPNLRAYDAHFPRRSASRRETESLAYGSSDQRKVEL